MIVLDKTKTETRLITGDGNNRKWSELEGKETIFPSIKNALLPAVASASSATGYYIGELVNRKTEGGINFFFLFFFFVFFSSRGKKSIRGNKKIKADRGEIISFFKFARGCKAPCQLPFFKRILTSEVFFFFLLEKNGKNGIPLLIMFFIPIRKIDSSFFFPPFFPYLRFSTILIRREIRCAWNI